MMLFSWQALKVLRTAEYAPFVVFIAAPTIASFTEVRTLLAVILFISDVLSSFIQSRVWVGGWMWWNTIAVTLSNANVSSKGETDTATSESYY